MGTSTLEGVLRYTEAWVSKMKCNESSVMSWPLSWSWEIRVCDHGVRQTLTSQSMSLGPWGVGLKFRSGCIVPLDGTCVLHEVLSPRFAENPIAVTTPFKESVLKPHVQ